MRKLRYIIWDDGHSHPQIRVDDPTKTNIVAILPSYPGHYCTCQNHRKAKRLANKIVKILNKETK